MKGHEKNMLPEIDQETEVKLHLSSEEKSGLVSDRKSSLLFKPSSEVVKIAKGKILTLLGSAEYSSLSQLKPFCDELLKDFSYQTLLQQLSQAVLHGDLETAEKIISQEPIILLLTSETEFDYSGHPINQHTPLQMALGAEDVNIQKNNEEAMTEMILRYLRKLPNGALIIREQIKNQFPSELEAKQNGDLDFLRAIAEQFVKTENVDCVNIVKSFHLYLDEQAKNPIKQGVHSRAPQMLIAAWRLAHEYFDLFGGKGSYKNKIFWEQIAGYIERFLPASYAYVLAQGLDLAIIQKENPIRSFNLRYNSDISFFPLDQDPDYRLGHEFAVINGKTSHPLFEKSPKEFLRHINQLEQLYQLKTERLKQIINENKQEPGIVERPKGPPCIAL